MTNADLIARLRDMGIQCCDMAADALTAQQAEIERLRGVLQECESALDLHGKMYPAMVKGYTLDALNSARAALAAPPTLDRTPRTAYSVRSVHPAT